MYGPLMRAVCVAAVVSLVGLPVAQAQNNPSAVVGVTLNAPRRRRCR